MALTHITESTLRAYLSDTEIVAFDRAASAGTKPARVSALIRANCDMVAGYVNASGRYPILPTGTDEIPAELAQPTYCLIRHALLADMPNMEEIEGSIRAKEYDRAVELLHDVREGRFSLQPFGLSAEESRPAVTVYAAGKPYQDWSSL